MFNKLKFVLFGVLLLSAFVFSLGMTPSASAASNSTAASAFSAVSRNRDLSAVALSHQDRWYNYGYHDGYYGSYRYGYGGYYWGQYDCYHYHDYRYSYYPHYFRYWGDYEYGYYDGYSHGYSDGYYSCRHY